MINRYFYSIIMPMERIDDLQFENLKIIQNTDGFRFGIDSVLLTEFARDIKDGEYIYQISTDGTIITFGLMAIGKIDVKNNGEKKKIEYNG